MQNTKKNRDMIERKRREIIDDARKSNLADYLLSKNVSLIRNGRRYKDAEHDSLVFTDNMYYWNKKQDKGNVLDYLIRYMGYSFNGAVRELTGVDITDDSEIMRYNRSEITNINVPKAFSMHNLILTFNKSKTSEIIIIIGAVAFIGMNFLI